MKGNKYITVADFGVRAKKSTATLYGMIKLGSLEYVEVTQGGRSVKMILVSELDKFNVE